MKKKKLCLLDSLQKTSGNVYPSGQNNIDFYGGKEQQLRFHAFLTHRKLLPFCLDKIEIQKVNAAAWLWKTQLS